MPSTVSRLGVSPQQDARARLATHVAQRAMKACLAATLAAVGLRLAGG